jgi:hypothetical protein
MYIRRKKILGEDAAPAPDLSHLSEEEQMRQMMGFGDFNTTKVREIVSL